MNYWKKDRKSNLQITKPLLFNIRLTNIKSLCQISKCLLSVLLRILSWARSWCSPTEGSLYGSGSDGRNLRAEIRVATRLFGEWKAVHSDWTSEFGDSLGAVGNGREWERTREKVNAQGPGAPCWGHSVISEERECDREREWLVRFYLP